MWKVVAGLSAGLAAVAARKVAELTWAAVAGHEPSENPADEDRSWTEALAWAIAAGVTAAVARVVAQRAAASGWERATGQPPPT